MDTIRYLLGSIIKITLGLLAIAFMLWLLQLVFPNFKATSAIKTSFSGDWLPAPKQYTGLLGTPNKDGSYGTEYKPGPEYNGYANQYVYNQTPNNQVWSGNTTSFVERYNYIRNLSVYEGGTISYGDTFVGEAKTEMFRNGLFTIVVIDRQGRVITTTNAINTGTWSVPGWYRFQATIPNRLPSGEPCSLVFVSGQTSARVGMPVRCQ